MAKLRAESANPKAADLPRMLAWEILRRVEEQDAYADVLLGQRSSSDDLAVRDQALLTRLVYGTLTWQAYLDHLLDAFSRKPVAALDPPVRTLLRLAAFQICVLTKIPPFAAVDTAVELAKQFRGGAAVGLVNAVLRKLATEWPHVQFPARAADPIGYLSTRLSHPRWLVERWIERYGFDEAEALCVANNNEAPTVLRVNAQKMGRDELLQHLQKGGTSAAPTTYSPLGIQLVHAGAPEGVPGYGSGWFSVQGEAAQLVPFLLAPEAGSRVLDACAAPGGKTTQIAEMMDSRGEIIALDTNPRGVERLKRMANRLGLSIIRPEIADVSTWTRSGERFDYVLVDAPCSGLGTLREHPELKWRRRPEDLARLAGMQRRLLTACAEHVRPGGVLVYATCTIDEEENEQTLAEFQRQRHEFVVDDPRPLLPAAVHPLIGADHCLRTLPHRHGLDGFFAVRLLKAHHSHGTVQL